MSKVINPEPITRTAALISVVGIPWLAVTVAPAVAPLAAVTVLTGVGAVAISLGWKSLDQYSKALAEGEQLEARERERLRGALLRDRLYVLLAFGIAGSALGTGAVVGKLLIPDPPLDPARLSALLFTLGASLAVALLMLGALLNLFLSLDGFIGEIRDLARLQRTKDQIATAARESAPERAALLSDPSLRISRLSH